VDFAALLDHDPSPVIARASPKPSIGLAGLLVALAGCGTVVVEAAGGITGTVRSPAAAPPGTV
jgi:hypothetical protein